MLNLIRNRQLVPDAAATNVMLRAADALRKMLDNIEHSNEANIQEHLTALQRIIAGDKSTQTAQGAVQTQTAGVELSQLAEELQTLVNQFQV